MRRPNYALKNYTVRSQKVGGKVAKLESDQNDGFASLREHHQEDVT